MNVSCLRAPVRLVALALILLAARPCLAGANPPGAAPIRARYLITVADDFIVDAYLNGRHIPDSKRVLLAEIYGATVERFNVEVHPGDWLVFNVVNSHVRWGGAYYFAVAGCLAPNEFGFVSRLDDGDWSACDTPGDAESFIAVKTYLQSRPALAVTLPWDQGLARMREYAGASWNGVPLWGASKNTWVKVQVE